MNIIDKIRVYFVKSLPITICTWEFQEATNAAYKVISEGGSAIDAVVAGCDACEQGNRPSVGYGGHFDENGEVTLDAMVMDGTTLGVGAVAGLRRIDKATKVAKAVMDHTSHSMLAGDLATEFAKEMGFCEVKHDSLLDKIKESWTSWVNSKCQPNYRRNVSPDAKLNCGPYTKSEVIDKNTYTKKTDKSNHDTVGVLAIDTKGNIAAACSSNGKKHKVPGRVGDSPLVGCGAYADTDVGASVSTGDGDQMMKLCPAYDVVKRMAEGNSPYVATQRCMSAMILKFRRRKLHFEGAIIAVNKNGQIGAACTGYDSFKFCVNTADKEVIYEINCQEY